MTAEMLAASMAVTASVRMSVPSGSPRREWLWLALQTLAPALLVLALFSNLRELPQRWVSWARQAIDETTPPDDALAPAPVPRPGESGRVGVASREG